MRPVDFEGSNLLLAKDQPEYQPLPVFRSEEGVVVSCWRLTLWERIKLLFTGRLWVMQLTFNNLFQPQLPMVECPIEDKNEGIHNSE